MLTIFYLFEEFFKIIRDPLFLKNTEGFSDNDGGNKNENFPVLAFLKNFKSRRTNPGAVCKPPNKGWVSVTKFI